MTFWKLLKSKGTVAKALAFVGVDCLVGCAAELLGGAGQKELVRESVRHALLATLLSSDMLEHAIRGAVMHASALHTNLEVTRFAQDEQAEQLQHNRKFNFDLEMQVGHTLAKVITDWAAGEPQAVRDIVAKIAAYAESRETDGQARWVAVAERVGLTLNEDQLVDVCLNRGSPSGEMSAPRVSLWAAFVKELAAEVDVTGIDENHTLGGALTASVAANFYRQFYIGMKSALDDPQHANAWAAMQYRIQAMLMAGIEKCCTAASAAADNSEAARKLTAEARQDILTLSASCAFHADQLWNRIAAAEQTLLADVKAEIAGLRTHLDGRFNEVIRELITLKARPPIFIPLVEAGREYAARLHFSARRSRVIGRDAEQALLLAFLQTPGADAERRNKFCWWLWTGPGGAGKSRLALETCLAARAELGWDAGFLSKEDDAAFTIAQWRAWSPARPTLVVFDYLSERADAISAIIHAVHQRDSAHALAHPVRFLLLDRTPPEGRVAPDFPPVGASRNSVTNAAYGGADPSGWHRNINETPIPDETIADLVAELHTQPLERAAVLGLLRRSDDQGRRLIPAGNPLFACVLAEVLRNHSLAEVHDADGLTLLKMVLHNEAGHWRERRTDGKHLNALAWATMLRRVVELGAALPTPLADLLPAGRALNERACDALSSYAGKARGPGQMLYLEPDRLGELLVLERVAGCKEVWAADETSAFGAQEDTAALWRQAWTQEPVIAQEFLRRAIADFPTHPGLREICTPPDDAPPDVLERWYWAAWGFGESLWTWQNLAAAGRLYSRITALLRSGAIQRPRRDLYVSLIMVANVERALGRNEPAAKLYAESLEISRALAEELGTPEARRDLSVSLEKVGNVELALGRNEPAGKFYAESLEICRALARELGTPEARRDLSVSLNNVGDVERALGRNEPAGELYTESLEISRALAEELGTPEARRALSVSLSKVGNVERALGRNEPAAKLYAESLEIRRALARKLGTPEARRDLSVSLNKVADVELALGRSEPAGKLYAESLKISRALAEELGTPAARRALSVSLSMVANVERARGRNEPAAKLYAESLEISRALAEELGTPEARRDLSISLEKVADVERAMGRNEPAGKLYAESLEISRALARELGTPEARRDLSVSLNKVGDVERALGRNEPAAKLYGESLEISRALARELVTPEARRDLSVSLSKVAYVERALGRNEPAAKLYAESLEISGALAKELGTPEARRDLSVSLERVGDVERALGRNEPAGKLYAESLEIRRTLARELGTPEARRDLSVSLNKVGDVEQALWRNKPAAKLYAESLEISRALARELGTPEARRDLATSHARMARMAEARRDSGAACEHLREGRQEMRAAMAIVGALPDYLEPLAWIEAAIARLGCAE